MFFITSIFYEKHMKLQTMEVEQAVEKATNYSFDGRKESVKSYGFYKFNPSLKKYEFEIGSNFSVKSNRDYS